MGENEGPMCPGVVKEMPYGRSRGEPDCPFCSQSPHDQTALAPCAQ